MSVRRCLSCVAAGLVAGCTGASSTELFDPPSQGVSATDPPGDSSGEGDTSGEAPDDPSSAGDPGAPSPSGTNEDGTQGSGADGNGDANGDGDGSGDGSGDENDGHDKKKGHDLQACAQEIEPNDSPESATTFSACLEGQVPTHDVDWTEIVAPPGATQMVVTHSETGGDIWLRVFSEGASSQAVTANAAVTVPVLGGLTYALVVEAAGDRTSTRHYRLTVTFS